MANSAVTAESPVISLMKLLHDYYAVKDSWRLRALAVRAVSNERDVLVSQLTCRSFMILWYVTDITL